MGDDEVKNPSPEYCRGVFDAMNYLLNYLPADRTGMDAEQVKDLIARMTVIQMTARDIREFEFYRVFAPREEVENLKVRFAGEEAAESKS